jgi:electron transfer flavoprotein beta subunit
MMKTKDTDMQVAAILRLVPDTRDELEIDETGTDIDREWVGFKLCEFDDQALEEAVLLKERGGATVTAIALAGDGTDKLLQTAIARGVDKVLRIEHDIEDLRDSAAVASVFAEAVRRIGADLVLTGVMTPEDILGQLAGSLGGRLGWPAINAATSVSVIDGGVQVRQEYSGGRATVFALSGPAVVGMQSASQAPRYVAGSKLRQAAGTLIAAETFDAEVPAAVARISGLSLVEAGGQAITLDGNAKAIAARIVGALAENGLIGA